jgi:hypothetical protein
VLHYGLGHRSVWMSLYLIHTLSHTNDHMRTSGPDHYTTDWRLDEVIPGYVRLQHITIHP